MEKVWVNTLVVVLAAIIFGGSGFVVGKNYSQSSKNQSTKTVTSTVLSVGEPGADVFQISHPNNLVIVETFDTSPVRANLVSYDRRDTNSYAYFSLESPQTVGSTPEKYEAYLKVHLGQNVNSGYTTRQLGNNTLYYFNGEEGDGSVKYAVLFLKNYTVRIGYLPNVKVSDLGEAAVSFNEATFNQIITSVKETAQ